MTSNGSDARPVSLDGVLPFAEFLQSLNSADFPVGLNELKSVEKLLRCWQGTNRDELRDALAALLARNQADVTRVKTAFDAWFRTESDTPQPAPPQPRSGTRTKRRGIAPWVAGAVLALAAVLAGVWLSWPTPVPPIQPEQTIPELDVRDTDVQVDALRPTRPAPLPGPPPRRPARGYPWLAAVLALLPVVTIAAEVRARRQRRRAAGRAADDELANAEGPHRYETTVRHASPPFPPSWVEEAATIIGRGVDEGAVSDVLDVDETLRLTLREGSRPVLRYAPPPRNARLLVLQDTGSAMQPWERKVAFLLTELKRQGIGVDHYVFDTDLTTVRGPYGATPIHIERLADIRADSSLLVIATGDGMDAVLREHQRLESILRTRWMRRSWLNPIANRRYWPSVLNRLPVNVWPLTRDGLRSMAWELAAAPLALNSQTRRAEVRDVSADDVERMKRLIALVPHPTLALAGELRRRYCADMPEEVVLVLAREGALHGERVLLREDEVKRLLADQRAEAPRREERVRRYLLEVLESSPPPEGSVARQRWDADRALQQVHLAAAAGSELPSEAVDRLVALAQGPLANEVVSALEATNAPRVLRERVTAAALAVDAELRRRAPRWAFPGAVATFLAAVVATAAYFAAEPLAANRGEELPHIMDAYQLTLSRAGDEYVVTAKQLRRSLSLQPNLLGNPMLVNDFHAQNAVFDTPYAVTDFNSGSWWYVRAHLADGNEAWSNVLWVPKITRKAAEQSEPMPTGTITVNFVGPDSRPVKGPFAATVGLEDGDQSAGLSGVPLELPAGDVLVRSGVRGYVSTERQVVVAAGQNTTVTIPLTKAGYIDVVAPAGSSGANIFVRQVDSSSATRWDKSTSYPPGRYFVEYRQLSFSTRETVVVESDAVARVTIDTPADWTTINVASRPRGAKIAIRHNGTFLDLDLSLNVVSLPPGDYDFVATWGRSTTSVKFVRVAAFRSKDFVTMEVIPPLVRPRTSFTYIGPADESETSVRHEWERKGTTWIETTEFVGNVATPEEISRRTTTWLELGRTEWAGVSGVLVTRDGEDVFIPDEGGGELSTVILERKRGTATWTRRFDLAVQN